MQRVNEQEEKWIEAACLGDVKAFEALMGQYEKRIYTICLRLLNESHEAYDAVQEVCIKIWRQMDRFRGESMFSTWVYRIATNTCLDRLRQRKKKLKVVGLNEAIDEKDVQGVGVDPWEDVSSYLAEREKEKILWQGINEMKESHRMIIILRDIEGYAYEEIAQFLGISVGTVKSRLSRARFQLKKILEQNKEPYCTLFV